MSSKKSMLMIWVVGSLLWSVFCFYTFNVHKVKQAYRSFDRYEEKIARGFKTPYYKRAYVRTKKQVDAANKDMGLFFLVGFAFPGLMLAFGTAVLGYVEEKEKKNYARQKN